MSAGTWYVKTGRTAVNWGSDVSGGVAQVDIAKLVVGTVNEQWFLFARAGQPVSSAQVTAAQAETTGGAVPAALLPAKQTVPGGTTAFAPLNSVAQAYPAPTPSGDTTGATDAAALTALFNKGYQVWFPPNATYYINSTIALSGYNGWVMPDNTKIVWAGAAGGSIAATAPYTATSNPPYYGSLVGGSVVYPKAKITSATKVIYIAQPAPSVISTSIYTDSQSQDNAYIAGSCGYVFDSNYNPGCKFRVEVNVFGQFEKCIYARTSHAQWHGIQVAFGFDGLVFDNDAIGSAAPPINNQVFAIHSWEMVNSVVRLKNCGLVTIVGLTIENHDIGTAVPIYADSTFNARAAVYAPWNVGGPYQPIAKHFGSGTIWVYDEQSGYANIWVGQANGNAYVNQTIVSPQMMYANNKTGFATASTSDVVALVTSTKVPTLSTSRMGVRLTGMVTTGGHPVTLKLWYSAANQAIGSAPATATQWGYTVQIPAGSGDTPVCIEWADGGANGAFFYLASVASPDGTSVTFKGQLQTYVPY